jgi:DNA adenine methylase
MTDDKKRILSIISRQGGKSRLYKELIPLFPNHLYYAEVFGGAGWVLLNKNESVIEIFNDLDSNIVNLFRVLRDFPGEFVNRLQLDIVSRKTFDDYKALPFHLLDPIDRAVKWYYVYYNSYNADMTSLLQRKVHTNPNRFNTRLPELVRVLTDRLINVVMEDLPFQDFFQKYDNKDFFYYLDPPYFEMHGYEIPFEEKDHVLLRDTLLSIKGKFLLSYNDHPYVRELYKDPKFHIQTIQTSYQAANRPGAYKEKTNKGHELVITNYLVSNKSLPTNSL